VSPRYENFIDGKWVSPAKKQYMVNLAPATAKPICEVARSTPDDVETALDAAHHAKDEWGRTSPAQRAEVLTAIADAIDAHREMLAVAESWENGKPVRETLAADIPLAADHFRYFAAAIRAEETKITEIDAKTIAYHFHEPLGVVGQIIPFNFPILMAAWKIAPALAAGNCTVIKPASATPWSILKLAEVIGHLVPPGVLNIVTGPGGEIGKALAANPRIAKVAFTGETVTGRLIMQYAAQNIIPVTLELGGKSPNVFFSDVMAADDAFLDKAVEGLVLYAFNKGEVCTCPSRALVQADIYDAFMERALARIAKIKVGNPLDTETMMGPQNSAQQLAKISSYVDIGVDEGATLLQGRGRGAGNRQRHAVRARWRGLDPGRQQGLPGRPRDRGRARLGELLPPVPGGRGLRRIQSVGHRARDAQDDARALQPDQEPARQLRRRASRLLLGPQRTPGR
jgi:aldehyde dehydrogenase